MPRKRIEASDIEISFEKGLIEIFGAITDYRIEVLSRLVRVACQDGIVWDSSEHHEGIYPGWADDAKEAIVQHSNAKLNLPRPE